jgi:signal transduction histidine kinase
LGREWKPSLFKSPLGRLGTAGADAAICILLVALSGSMDSPFLLYSLAPVLTAALTMDRKVTFIIGGVMAVAVVISEIFSPLYPLSQATLLSHLTLYGMVIFLVLVLPYTVNMLRRHLEDNKTLQERHRRSREIHDGAAQTLHVLCWQIQELRRQPMNKASDYEIQKVEKLAQKARRDILASLEMLRYENITENLVTVIRKQVEVFKRETEIDCVLTPATTDSAGRLCRDEVIYRW